MIPTWAERCEKFDDGEIITNAKIQQVMQEEIDELRERLEETRQLYIKELAKASEK
jgi:aspartate/tyrosine/aromatic aminotransferase